MPSPIAKEVESNQYYGTGFKVKEIILPENYLNDDTSLGKLYDYAVLVIDTDHNL